MFVHIFPFINYVKYCILSYYRYNYERSYESFTTIRIIYSSINMFKNIFIMNIQNKEIVSIYQ